VTIPEIPYGDLLVTQVLRASLDDVTVRTRWEPDYVTHLPHIVVTSTGSGTVQDDRGRYTHVCDLEVFVRGDKNDATRLCNRAIRALFLVWRSQQTFAEGTVSSVTVDVSASVIPTTGLPNDVVRVNATITVGIRPAS
jgi:hypothetical protein